jgi:hypothetical protein
MKLAKDKVSSFKAVMPDCHPYARARNVPLKRCLPEAVK